MTVEIRPQEEVVENLLRTFPFDKEHIKNFVENFFLRRIIINKKYLYIEFLYLENINPTLEFTQSVEYFFKIIFQDNLVCDFTKASASILKTYKHHRKNENRWDTSFIPLASQKTFMQNYLPNYFLPNKTVVPQYHEPARTYSNDYTTVESTSEVLPNANKNILTPIRKTSAQKKIVPADKIFVETISGSIKKIEEIYLMDRETSHRVIIHGEIGTDDRNGVKLREFKTGTCMVNFALTDDTDGIVCKKIFDNKEQAEIFASRLKDLTGVKIKGTAQVDKYLDEMILQIDLIQPVDTAKNVREDNAEIKRVELHVHTTMSAMDAIISPESLIMTAADWNWSAVAITDHGVIQAFPAAADTVEKLAKKGKHIKVIYGMEGYLTTEENQKYAYHVILLAKNKVGLGNLYRLVSISQLKYFYRKPRIPKEILAKFREGLISAG